MGKVAGGAGVVVGTHWAGGRWEQVGRGHVCINQLHLPS